jgi:PAS domain S-box-containing protein
VNSAAASLVRKQKEEIIGQLRSTLFPAEITRKQGRSLRHVLKTGEPFRTEGQMEVNGTMRWFDHLLVPIDDGYGRVSSVLGISRDITERKQAEEALALASRKLNLLSSITRHDILNQLTALRGYLEISRGVLFDPQALHELLEKEVRVAETIERQITFTRDYQDMGVKRATWQNATAVIDRAMAALPMRNIFVSTDRPGLEVFADPLLEKVFGNLIENSLRYGGDRMTTVWFSSQESDSGLTIVCEDDGAGISGEDKKHLFERGFGRNSGLGLFLSREILGITGITITETSTGVSGARFEIAVPKGSYRFPGVRETTPE